MYLFVDDQLRVIDARTDVTSLARWDGIVPPSLVAYTTADGGVFVGDALGSTLGSTISATSVDSLFDRLALLRTPTDLWAAASGGGGLLFYRGRAPIGRFELEGARLLVQERCGDGFATVSIDAATTTAQWLSLGGGWPFDTRDFGEGPRLQPVTGGGGFLVRPDQL